MDSGRIDALFGRKRGDLPVRLNRLVWEPELRWLDSTRASRQRRSQRRGI